jgi:hypothetical protein
MAAKKRATTLKGKGKVVEPEFDFMKFFNQYRRQIIIAVSTVCIIVIICLFYIFGAEKAEGSAWHSLTTFINNNSDPRNVTDTAIQAMLSETKGTSAEPWALYYCSSIYFGQKSFENALKMINDLEQNFEDHYIVKDHRLLENLKMLINREKAWKIQTSSESDQSET